MTLPVDADKAIIFVKTYLENGDAVAACREAGLLDKQYPVALTAERTLERPEIAFAIKVLQDRNKLPDLPPGSREEQAGRIQSLINAAMKSNNLTAANQAASHQSKLLGYLDTNVNVTVRQDINTMTTEDLLRIAHGAVIDGEFTEVGPGSVLE